MTNKENIQRELVTEDDYRSIRNMLGALAEKIIWQHTTLCESEEDVTIAAIANTFVQEHGDDLLLNIISKLTEIYQRENQRYQLVTRINGDQFQTVLKSFPTLEDCVEEAKTFISSYDGNHFFTIIDTSLVERRVYDNDEVREMIKKQEPELKAYRVELWYNLYRDLRVMATNGDEALDKAREMPLTIKKENLQEIDCFVEEIK